MSDKEIIEALEEENRILKSTANQFKDLHEEAKGKIDSLVAQNKSQEKRLDELLLKIEELERD